MAITYGSTTGRRERDSFRTQEGELDCGQKIYIWTKNIQKSEEIEDEFSICSIGAIIGASYSGEDVCVENASIRVTEDASPIYKPRSSVIGQDPSYLEGLGNSGESSDELACPVRIRRTEVEISVDYKGDSILTAEEVQQITTSDYLYRLVSDTPADNPLVLIPDLASLTFVLVDKTQDRPQDDFVMTSLTYRARIGYPSEADRQDYIEPIATDFGATFTFGGTFVGSPSTSQLASAEIEGSFRQGETPTRRIVINNYGITTLA